MTSQTTPSKTRSPKLSDTQLIILSEASQRPDRMIIISTRLKGNAGNMAVNALLRRGLIESFDNDLAQMDAPNGKVDGVIGSQSFRISDAGFSAIGFEPEGSEAATKESAAIREARPKVKQQKASIRPTKAKAPRRNSSRVSAADKKSHGKQHYLITLLTRPKGASLDELMKASGWQAHSVRGFLSGTVKTKLGLNLERTSDPRRGSIYRIQD